MSQPLLVGLLVASILGPLVVAIIVLVVVGYTKGGAAIVAYSIGMLVLLAVIVASVGFHAYAIPLHASWWDLLWMPDAVAAVLTIIIALAATVDMLGMPAKK